MQASGSSALKLPIALHVDKSCCMSVKCAEMLLLIKVRNQASEFINHKEIDEEAIFVGD